MVTSIANNGGLGASTLNNPYGVAVSGSTLAIADNSNNRVLIWNSIPASHAQAADVVLGQPDMTSNSANNGGISTVSLSAPRSVYIAGGKLFVADSGNHRILIWNTVPTATQTPADVVISQANFTSGASSTSLQSLKVPNGIFSDGTRMIVTDSWNHRVLIWDSVPTQINQPPDTIFGQADTVSRQVNSGGLGPLSVQGPWSTVVVGSNLYLTDTNNNRILVIPL